MKKVLHEYRAVIGGLVHCSGGAQTKVLHFINDLKVVKNNLFELPPLFKIIQEESGTSWEEMYKVFNMGHRMEVYIDEKYAQGVIDIAKSFNIDAKVIGYCETYSGKQVQVESEFGKFIY